ncbi:hypothetical protein [Haloprofundus halobius]|uniref:hypothetical protein n=1 Tax=Haloprofundus halobius TaxID=2876194 RepID=UPI001CCE91AC|nr:hypothetical protein [Haloprofundus halobius]
MSLLTDRLGIPPAYQRGTARLMQLVLAGIAGYGLVTGQFGLVVNGTLPLLITLVPGVLRRDYGLPMNAGLTLWVTAAVFLHTLGMVGLYDAFGWYDQLTHVLSGSVIAGCGYAVTRALELHSDDVEFPEEFVYVYMFIFVLAFGVLWEIMEFSTEVAARVFGGQAYLAIHGVRDIALDFTSNGVGAVLVALLVREVRTRFPAALAREMDE